MAVKEFFQRHWKVLAIAGAGVVGLYLLTQRSGGGAPAGASDAGLPATGPPPVGDQTPASTFFSPEEQVAAGLAGQLQGLTMFATPQAAGTDTDGHAEYSYGTGAVSKAWQQVVVEGQTAWEDIYHPGHIISEQQAQQLAPQDHGPYAQASGGFFGQVATALGSVAKTALGTYLTGLTRAPLPATPKISPTPKYGNTPTPQPPGNVVEVV